MEQKEPVLIESDYWFNYVGSEGGKGEGGRQHGGRDRDRRFPDVSVLSPPDSPEERHATCFPSFSTFKRSSKTQQSLK